MKANEIRGLSMEERHRKLTELKESLFNLRFQHETGQLENPQKLKAARRDIARLQTIIKEEQAKQAADQNP